jgi:FdrA protein
MAFFICPSEIDPFRGFGRSCLDTPSAVQARVLRHEYRDSMVLMYLSARLQKMEGVMKAAAVMGTEANKDLLTATDLISPEIRSAGPQDLVVVVRAVDGETASRTLSRLEEILAQGVTGPEPAESFYYSLERAAQALPGANLALISVPGIYAAREARKALEAGLHVFLFSNHVPLEEEVSLKSIACERGLLVMGPDCGTALINGTALGFGNVVRRGKVGIVAASGTGIQEVTVLLDQPGLGISHAVGTGGRDLSAEVGAITTIQGIDLLEEDPATLALAILSKSPSPEVLQRVMVRLKKCPKPVIACFLGSHRREVEGNIHLVPTLAEAAQTAARLLGGKLDGVVEIPPGLLHQARLEGTRLKPEQRFVRGLFSGGSLCKEAQVVWEEWIGPGWSNIPGGSGRRLPDPLRSLEHTALDLGEDFFTRGRPHPMIDPAGRSERILQEVDDPGVAVILLDVVLGYGAHEDMAGALLPAIRQARHRALSAGRALPIVAHVVGTEADPQGLGNQENQLRSAGVIVCPSNAVAARLASVIAQGHWKKGGPNEP